jgi:hypothetical protein
MLCIVRVITIMPVSFEEVSTREQEKHLLEFHRIANRAIHNRKSLRNWFANSKNH